MPVESRTRTWSPEASRSAVLVAGVAGLVAGAMAMGLTAAIGKVFLRGSCLSGGARRHS